MAIQSLTGIDSVVDLFPALLRSLPRLLEQTLNVFYLRLELS